MHEISAVCDTGPVDGSGENYWDVIVEGVVRARVPAYGFDTEDGQKNLAERIGRILDMRIDGNKLSLGDLIGDLYLQVDTAEMSFLQQRGWKHTSSTPNYTWRWVKALDDGTKIMATRKDALSIEGIHNC